MRYLTMASLATLAMACSPSNTEDTPAPMPEFQGERLLEGLDLVRFLDCSREQGVSLIAAHRAGPRPGYAENAISTMFASVEAGAPLLEVDVIETRDGDLVMLHDRTLDRTTTGTGEVAEISTAEFTALRLVDQTGSVLNESPPLLSEVLEAMDGVAIVQLDLKGVSSEKIVAAVEAADAMDRIVTITYRNEQALELHALAPEMVLSVGVRSLDDIRELQEAGMDLTRMTAWLGVGRGNRELDMALTELGIETAYGDFRGEDENNYDYVALASGGGELLSIDNVLRASDQLDAQAGLTRLLETCEGVFPDR